MWSLIDYTMMNKAIFLARKGRFTTAPNPCVGCVIVKNGVIIGEGYHLKAGKPHAEVHALKQAAENATDATAYVTLEPCSHYGRTPPCAKALIKARVKRVVVAMEDPNPQVKGNGIKLLRDAGIQVDVGLFEADANALNTGFIKRMKLGLPYVTVKLAASLDGKTALANGKSKWITGAYARQDVQRLRAANDAVITGVETVIADNPSLNVRYSELGFLKDKLSEGLIKQPLRIVLDSQARLTALQAQHLFAIPSPILLVSCVPYSTEQQQTWPQHVSSTQFDAVGERNRVDLNALLKHLGQTINHLMVESGATLAGAFIEQDLVDELVLYQAPKILGATGRNLVQLPNYQAMQHIPSLQLVDERKLGPDSKYVFRMISPNKIN